MNQQPSLCMCALLVPLSVGAQTVDIEGSANDCDITVESECLTVSFVFDRAEGANAVGASVTFT